MQRAMPPASRRPPAPIQVRRAGLEDARPLASVLARAFEDDPVAVYLFTHSRTRERALRRFFGIQLAHGYLPAGEVWTTEDLAGAALWAPPSKARPTPRDLVQMLPVLPYLAGRRMLRAVSMIARMEALRPSEEHWYLATLGTEPQRQGQGVGSALLRRVLSRCDEEGMPAYLESSKERNVPFYRRHGFEVMSELHLPREGPTLWLMWREARPPSQ